MTPIVHAFLSSPPWLALLLVFALPALESSAFLGIVFPGELAVLLGGVLASQGHVPLAGVLTAGIAGAVIGDAVGYVVGRLWGRRILDSTLGHFVRATHLDRAERALARRGEWAVLLGRFTVALRVLVPGLAGMARMSYPRFALANVAGGTLWATAVVLTGYLAGRSWQSAGHTISAVGIALTVAVIAVVVARRLLPRLRRS